MFIRYPKAGEKKIIGDNGRLVGLSAVLFNILQDLRPDKIYPAPLLMAGQTPVHPVMEGNKGNAEQTGNFFAA
jgi:hypothetical protein